MSSRLFTHIKQLAGIRDTDEPLAGADLAVLPVLDEAYLIVEGEEIAGYGLMAELKKEQPGLPNDVVDCQGRSILPCWCDSHTHLVFAGSRETEFADRIRGDSYAAISRRGGGILSTVRQVQEASEDQLFQLAWERLSAISRVGTGAVEIKSGYGLTVEDELKMLRVIKKLRQQSPLLIRSTFLGAHSFPLEYRDNHEAYLRLLIDCMLPIIAREELADYIDVFCEQGFFSVPETETILKAGVQAGLKPKLHCNQLTSLGGIAAGIRQNALSLDHLEEISPEDLLALGEPSWRGICTLLPTASLFLNLPAPPARTLVDAGCRLALASDFNPGSSPGGNMNLVLSLACLLMKLSPEEAINAATINGAFAMGLEDSCGSITRGKLANLIFTRPVPSMAYLPYAFGSNSIDRVMIRGAWVDAPSSGPE